MYGTDLSSWDNQHCQHSMMPCPTPIYYYGSPLYPNQAPYYFDQGTAVPYEGMFYFVALPTDESGHIQSYTDNSEHCGTCVTTSSLPSNYIGTGDIEHTTDCCTINSSQECDVSSEAPVTWTTGFYEALANSDQSHCKDEANPDESNTDTEEEVKDEALDPSTNSHSADEELSEQLQQPHIKQPFYNYYHLMPSEVLGRPVFLTTRRIRKRLCVYDVWKDYMKLLFRNLPDVWDLKVAKPNYKPVTGWSSYKDFAKVRFACKVCRTGWTSMCGVVMFSFRWNFKIQQGQILHHIMGQKCGVCNPKNFEMPIWYPEEAQKIMTNLYYKICNDVYGLKTPQFIRARRSGISLSSHNGKLCQGCLRGVCLNKCHS